jgi:aquaporin Z
MKKYIAELIGTMWLVLGGCGSAVLACTVDNGIGYLGVALAFGLTVVSMAYAIGHISGCHLNPAVSMGLWAGGRFSSKDLVPYIVSQTVGAILGAGIIYLIYTNNANFKELGGFATNGFGKGSPEGYNMVAALIIEIVLTAVFLYVIMGVTCKKAAAGFAPLAIGLTLTLIHLISIPVTNTSVNPARSTGMAVFTGGLPMEQLWLFWVAPIVGGVIGALVYNFVNSGDTE